VVQRELREGARKPVNHRLRMVSAGLGIVLLWLVISALKMPPAQMGGWLLGTIHSLLLTLILVFVPALAADGIARERRDGTLGLLFLTPLSAGGIVTGKALAQAMRAFNLWLAVTPVLTIPFLTGGVTRYDGLCALSIEFCATVLCLGAGLLASTFAKERNSAFILGFLLGIAFWVVFMLVEMIALISGWRGVNSLFGNTDWRVFNVETFLFFAGLGNVRGGAWSALMFSPRLGQVWGLICAIGPVVSLLVLFMIGWFAARRIERSWQDKIPSPRRENLVRRYCTPVFRRRFQRQMTQTLEWNPIAWLQQYSWKARLSKWGLCLGFVLVLWAINGANDSVRAEVYFFLWLVLVGIYTFVGVSGFLEEKRSGALELLLITPISVNKLIFGRVWGLWKQFLPSALVLAACIGFLQINVLTENREWYEALQVDAIVVCGFLLLPVLATYFALRVKNLVVAAVLTWVALCLPNITNSQFFLPSGMRFYLRQQDLEFSASIIFCSYVGFAFVACFLLRHSLSRRIYSF
jgi:ABC-type Na+ efflux pump permease subunit